MAPTRTFEVRGGSQVASVVFQQLRFQLEEVLIVTPFLHDYFWPLHSKLLSRLLADQVTENAAKVTVLTHSPMTEPSSRTQKRKFELLRSLEEGGVEVEICDKLHAKVFLFRRSGFAEVESSLGTCWIVGSANLTKQGFEYHLELSLQGSIANDFERIRRKALEYVGHSSTLQFSQWKAIEKNFVGLASVQTAT